MHRDAVFPELGGQEDAGAGARHCRAGGELVDRALEAENVEFMTAIGNVVPITMISRLVGFRNSNLEELWTSAVNGTRLVGSTLALDDLLESASGMEGILVWIAGQLSVALDEPSEDLLGTVANAVNNAALTEAEAIGILTTLLSAGGETTTSLLGNAVRMLAERPELQEHLRQNPEQIATFAEEALRIESPFRYMMRFVPRHTTLGGTPSRPVLRFSCSGGRPTETPTNSSDPMRLISSVAFHDVTWRSGAVSTTVSGLPSPSRSTQCPTVLLDRTKTISLQPDHSPSWVSSLLVRRHEQLPVQLEAR